jgi:hypothetical protein
MSINVKLSETLVDQAKHYAVIEHRSVPKQIEYWSQIGKLRKRLLVNISSADAYSCYPDFRAHG